MLLAFFFVAPLLATNDRWRGFFETLQMPVVCKSRNYSLLYAGFEAFRILTPLSAQA